MVKSTKMKSSSDKKKTDDEKGHDDDAAGKFRIYYDFQKSTKDLLPHQVNKAIIIVILRRNLNNHFYIKKEMQQFSKKLKQNMF